MATWMRTAGSARVLAALLALGCAAAESRSGVTGPVSWEVIGEDLVLRETVGVGITFTSLRASVPLQPVVGGRGSVSGSRESPLARRLEPGGEVRIRLGRTNPPAYVEYELVGFDDTGRSISVPVRVRW